MRSICVSCHRDIPSLSRFCPWCGGSALEPQPADPPLPHDRDELRIGERRTATALFSDLAGYTSLAEVLDPEEVARVMNRLKRTAISIIEGHGGTVNQFAGDEVMALFGVPRANDDDPSRAVRAAFELHAAVRDQGDELASRVGQALRLHTGIDTGLMITQLRDRRDGIYGVTGNAINTAARLAKQAEPDEILTGPGTWGAIRERFETQSLDPRTLRGKAEPIVPHRVLREKPRLFSIRSDEESDELCGRAAELEALRSSFEETRAGHAHLVAVSGEPGVGKTRLLQEFARLVSDQALVLRGVCPSFGAVAPYQPFRDLLRTVLLSPDQPGSEVERVVARVRQLGPECEPHIPALLTLLSIQVDASPLPSEAASDRVQEAMLAAFRAFFGALAHERSTVLLLENWHWADPASELVLEHLTHSLAGERLLLLVSFRSDFEPSWSVAARRLDLAPLGLEDTRALLRQILGEVSDSLLQQIQERTGGNPLFIEELCQSVRETGAEHRLSSIGIGVVPDSVAAVVRARIDRLAPAQVELLKLAAVLGEEFSRALLEKMSGSVERLTASLEGLVRAQLIVEQQDGESWRFKHAIVQDVAYAMLFRARRRFLHAAVGHAIEELAGTRVESWIERLAHHFARSDDRDKAIIYLERSGDKAASSGAMQQALGHFREAVAILDEQPRSRERMRRRIELSQKLALAATYRPRRSVRGVLDLSYEFALRLGDERAQRRSLYWIGWLDASLGNWPDAIATFERCIPLAATSGDAKLLAQIESNLGQACFHIGETARAERHLERAIELRRGVSSELAAGPIIAYSQAYLALIDSETGRFDRADARLEDGFKRAALSGKQLQLEGALQTIRCVIESARGDWSACRAAAEDLESKAHRIGSTYMLAMSHSLGGFARFVLGEYETGIEAMRSGIELLERAENQMNLSRLYALLGTALTGVGAIDEGESLARRALQLTDETQDRIGEPGAYRVLMLVEARRAPRGSEKIDAMLDAALAAARRRGSAREELLTWYTAAGHLTEARDPAWRRRVLSDCRERFVAFQMPRYAERASVRLKAILDDPPLRLAAGSDV